MKKRPKRPKLPKTLKILSVQYDVEEVDDFKDKEDPDLLGDSNGYTRKIRVKTDQFRDSTLVHEIAHQILHVSGIAQILNSEELEEAIVLAFEHGFSPYFTLAKATK